MSSMLAKLKVPGLKTISAPPPQEEKPVTAMEKAEIPALLEVRDLKVFFRVMKGTVHAVDGVDLVLNRGETLGLVGESGCGKTTLAYAITRLLPNNGAIVSGSVKFEGHEIGVPEYGIAGELLGLLDRKGEWESEARKVIEREKRTVEELRREADTLRTREVEAARSPADRNSAPRPLGKSFARVPLDPFTRQSWVIGGIVFGLVDIALLGAAFSAGGLLGATLVGGLLGLLGALIVYAMFGALGWRILPANSPAAFGRGRAGWFRAESEYRARVLDIAERSVESTKGHADEWVDPGARTPRYGRRVNRRQLMKRKLRPLQDGSLLRRAKRGRDARLAERVNDIRWKDISIIFQGAMNAFNPVFKVGEQIVEALTTHEPLTREQARERTIKLFELVGIDPGRIDGYPHEFSGGMKQRAMIAMALACNPKLVLADEPTTALDVIMQDRVLAEIRDLQKKFNMALIIITHDISVVAETANRIAIMYAGHILEYGDISAVFRKPCNPYTIGLLAAYPKITGKRSKLVAIPGTPPDLVNPPSGCRFHPRCRFVQDICKTVIPPKIEVEPDHSSMCHFAKEIHSGELR